MLALLVKSAGRLTTAKPPAPQALWMASGWPAARLPVRVPAPYQAKLAGLVVARLRLPLISVIGLGPLIVLPEPSRRLPLLVIVRLAVPVCWIEPPLALV